MGLGDVHETLKMLAKDFDEAGIEYAIIGGMALNAHGYRRETVDVDVLIRPDGLEEFRNRLVGRGYVGTFSGAKKSFRNTRTNTVVEFIATGEYPGDGKPKPVAFPDPAKVKISIDGICVVDLPTLINLKLASGMTQPARRRDLADVQELIRILSLKREYVSQLDSFVHTMYDTLFDELQQTDPHRKESGE
ncbi:MAG: hypothetical protein IH989_08450 [Planctomycetes bacterium]|nr:hypothetical protein [Planctomycetota bacterium]